MNVETPAGRGLENTAGERVQTNLPTGQRRSPRTRVGFVAADVVGFVLVDLKRPANGDRFEYGEVGRRLHRATAGLPAGTVVQIVVSEATPTHEAQIPEGVRVQISAPDAGTLRRWLEAVSRG